MPGGSRRTAAEQFRPAIRPEFRPSRPWSWQAWPEGGQDQQLLRNQHLVGTHPSTDRSDSRPSKTWSPVIRRPIGSGGAIGFGGSADLPDSGPGGPVLPVCAFAPARLGRPNWMCLALTPGSTRGPGGAGVGWTLAGLGPAGGSVAALARSGRRLGRWLRQGFGRNLKAAEWNSSRTCRQTLRARGSARGCRLRS